MFDFDALYFWGYLYLLSFGLVFWGWLADRLLGDPNSYHPIVFFGRLIAWGEKRYNRGRARVLKGFVYNLALILLFPMLAILLYVLLIKVLDGDTLLGFLVLYVISNAVVFYMLSGTTLVREVKAVFEAVDRSLDEGRRQVARIVGRDTERLSEQEVRTAALETLSENLSDGVIAPMFWYMLLNIPGILMYKMTNTQDSMIGYKNERYYEYGRFSAKFDDLLNWIPARLTALLMLISAWRLDLLPFVWSYGKAHASPNSGYPEAALAGILGCRFGGPHDYFGQEVYKPYIGEVDRPLTTEDMLYAIKINRRAELLMLFLLFVSFPLPLLAFSYLAHNLLFYLGLLF